MWQNTVNQVMTMMDEDNKRECMSALADGQLRAEAFAQAVALACDDADAQAAWQMHHLVGDVLRSGELARRDSGGSFAAGVLARLQQEDALAGRQQPVVVAAIPSVAASAATAGATGRLDVKKEAANSANFRWKMVAGFASLAAVAAIGWNSASTLWNASPGAQLAQSSLPAQSALIAVAAPQLVVQAGGGRETPAVMLRDPRLDELLAAHKQLGGGSALQTPAGFLRNATFDDPGR